MLVTKATKLRPYRHLVHTIITDNGKEFSLHEKITEALDAQVYFAHPYLSWGWSLNENTIGLILPINNGHTAKQLVAPQTLQG
ncbi:hypothetical protein BTJ40_06925 [Microbulbifer sp. A4B17]|nr:hypothetical protein BTJ40_06925 [Microbulbifer sp. A4B17]